MREDLRASQNRKGKDEEQNEGRAQNTKLLVAIVSLS